MFKSFDFNIIKPEELITLKNRVINYLNFCSSSATDSLEVKAPF